MTIHRIQRPTGPRAIRIRPVLIAVACIIADLITRLCLS